MEISKINFNESSPETVLKESLGHTKIEVLVGSLFGPIVALPGIFFIGSPLHILQMIGLFSVCDRRKTYIWSYARLSNDEMHRLGYG